MNKAGSSSIQASLADYDDGRLRYVRLGAANHSKAISTLVMAHPQTLNAHRIQGLGPAEIAAEKERFARRLDGELALDREAFIVSGEGIAELGRNDTERLKALIEAKELAPQLIAYIREPVGFASSMFQQSVKFGGRDFRVTPPGYRKKFRDFLDLYGEGSIAFVPFAREGLAGGSAVTDLAMRVGADPARFTEQRVNERLSAEAAAFLYFWNRESAGGAGSKTIVDARREVIRLLGEAFPGRFRLGPRAIAAAIDPRDIAWMEEKAGFALAAPAGAAADGPLVEGHADLEAIREDARPALATLLDRHGVTAPAAAGTSALLDRLLQAVMAGEARPRPAATAPGAAPAAAMPDGIAEALAQAIWRTERRPDEARRFADERDDRIANAEAIIGELVAAGVRFERS